MTVQAATPIWEKVRADFPILHRLVGGRPWTYLDSAATSQKPNAVIEAVDGFYRMINSNVHRGIYQVSEEATEAFEGARGKVAQFINAASPREIVFVRNATEAINLVAYTWGRVNVDAGDTIVVSEMEHHSNLVPWQQLARESGANLCFIPLSPSGELALETLDQLLADRPKLVALGLVSNSLGTINPVAELVRRSHAAGALVLVDAAQAVPHLPVDVQALDCDFLAFSGHKMMGPTGTGVLWARRSLLEAMPPFLFGGSMISEVSMEGATWNEVPHKFEAGTPDIAGAVGLGAAVDYLTELGMDNVKAHESELLRYALDRLDEVDGVVIYGPPAELRSGLISFNLADIHPHDLATILDHENVAIRAGHHCAQPVMRRLGVSATSRASFYVYNDRGDVDRLVDALQTARRVFKLDA